MPTGKQNQDKSVLTDTKHINRLIISLEPLIWRRENQIKMRLLELLSEAGREIY